MPITTTPDAETDDRTSWVHAAPFRAHLRHVAAVSGLPWPVLAVLAGVSTSLADHLLHGRNGRPVRRLARESAARLLELTPDVALTRAAGWVPPDRATRIARHLADRGWAAHEIADAGAVDHVVVRALLFGEPSLVPRIAEARLLVLVATLDRRALHEAAA